MGVLPHPSPAVVTPLLRSVLLGSHSITEMRLLLRVRRGRRSDCRGTSAGTVAGTIAGGRPTSATSPLGAATNTCSLSKSFDHFSRGLGQDSDTKNRIDKLF